MNDLDIVYSRKHTGSKKWDNADKIYKNPDIIPMWLADMDFQAPACVREALTRQVALGFYGYTSSIDAYKVYITEWLKKRHNWTVEEDSIFFSQSVLKALSLLIRALSSEGDGVLIHIPCYHPFIETTNNTKRKVVISRLADNGKEYGIDFADFEEKIVANNVKLFLLCNPHNPTGRVWTKDELSKIISLCQKYKVIIISDEIHSDLTMPGYTCVPAARVSAEYEKHIITLRSISKTFSLAGVRLGYIITTNDEYKFKLAELQKYNNETYSANSLSGPALKAAYTEGEEWLEKIIRYINSNYHYVKEQIAAYPELVLYELQATYLIWINLSAYQKTVSERGLAAVMDQMGIGLQTNSEFGLPDGLYVRINIACPRSILAKGIASFVAGVEKLKEEEKEYYV